MGIYNKAKHVEYFAPQLSVNNGLAGIVQAL